MSAERYDPLMKPDDPRRALIIDTLIAVGMFVLGVGSMLVWEGNTGPAPREPDFWAYALIGGQTLPLIWRRRYPVWVLSFVVFIFVIDRGINYPSSWAFFGIAIAMYSVGSQLPPKRSLLVGGIALDVVLLWTLAGIYFYDIEWFALISVVAVLGFPLLIGRETYHREQRMLALERRAIKAEHEREQRANEAVNRERVRIARELHDVVAHEITVMTIQSAGARRIVEDDPARAKQAMESAEAAGHRALTEVRRMLGVLRTTDPTAMDPQPGMADLDRLVDQMNEAGLPTSLEVSGEVRSLPLGVDLNAYRIIQESLTNTLKHGGPDVQAEISIAYEPDSLAIEINDDGRGAAAWQGSADEPGQGLVGMHERAAILDGAVHTGPRPGGGYRVAAKIPIPSA
ncbi:MAG: sensor histidine kinase [Acidimicrobiia bacterium]|nr:sensor histidine kinase [Acidimicrobiia bacterium]